MIRLITTEFHRFWSRRIVWVTTAMALAIVLLAFVISFMNTTAEAPTDNGAIAEAQRQTESCLEYFTNLPDAELARDFPEFGGQSPTEIDNSLREGPCYQDPAWYRGEDKRFFALEILTDQYALERTTDENQTTEITAWSESRPDSSVEYSERIGTEVIRRANDGLIGGVLPSVATFSLVLAVIIGASFVGAEYKSGTVENLLLWEPRRLRVISAKFIAGFVSSTVVTTIFLAWLVGLFYLLANVHGSTQGVDSRFWIDVFSVGLRASIVGGLFFVMAMSVAIVARNTTASVGLILGWFAVSNIAIELAAKSLRRYELFVNALAFTTEANVPNIRTVQGNEIIAYSHSYLTAGVVLLIWAAVIGSFAAWTFVRRDID